MSAQALWMARSINDAICSRDSTVGDLVKASRIGFPSASASRIDFTACALATSPAACPPMPSATAYSPRSLSTRKASSLCLRLCPTSVRAQLLMTGIACTVSAEWLNASDERANCAGANGPDQPPRVCLSRLAAAAACRAHLHHVPRVLSGAVRGFAVRRDRAGDGHPPGDRHCLEEHRRAS